MALAGSPQWLPLRSILITGTGGTTNEVDAANYNGQDKFAAPSVYAEVTTISKTITAGPTTTSPVLVGFNGIWWALPFNVAATAPQYVWDQLQSAQGWVAA